MGHGLELRECEAIRDRWQHKNIRAFIELAHAVAGRRAVETHIRRGFHDELVSDGNGAGDVDLDVFAFQEFCCFEKVLDAFAKVDLAEEEHAERLGVRLERCRDRFLRGIFGFVGEGNDMDFIGWDTLLDESVEGPL